MLHVFIQEIKPFENLTSVTAAIICHQKNTLSLKNRAINPAGWPGLRGFGSGLKIKQGAYIQGS